MDDQFTPDNWIPRSSHFIRLTGKHPLNGKPELQALFGAGLITPNSLHYVRNHGPVPHPLWETHQFDVEGGNLVLSTEDLASNYNYEIINIAVAMACDGSRRKELNMIQRSKGFNWGAGAISCAFWKGPLLRDVLLAVGIQALDPLHEKRPRWVHLESVDDLREGKYATSIPLAYVMDSENDVILAYEMNNMRLPPDHGYPNLNSIIVHGAAKIDDNDDSCSVLYFRHPCEPGTGTGGWMQPSSAENRIENIKHEAASPQKQFTREEIERHKKENDCWVVINGKVYDATSVLDWHPGGKAPIMVHSECVLSVVTEKTIRYIKKQAEDEVKDKFNSPKKSLETVFDRHWWNVSLREEDGTFDLFIKTYAPGQSQPSGTISDILDCLHPSEEIEVKGPSGKVRYIGQERFMIDDKEYHFPNASLVLGGSGITPVYQLISRITEGDILLRNDLDKLAKNDPGRCKITHVLSNPNNNWTGEKCHVSKDILQKYAFEPEKGNLALLCGPPTMFQKAVLPVLREIGYKEDENLLGF
ncbi:Eukaryotic molybdopterin oxidoreductase [Penicillium expansum]|nr:Eukaryotic molybdopterin oxidoreductase [Penicillium expansum]